VGDVVEPAGGPGDEPRECRTGDQPVPGDLRGYRARAHALGCGADCHRLRPPGAGRVAEDGDPTRRGSAGSSASMASPSFHDIRGDRGGICHQICRRAATYCRGRSSSGTDSHTTSHGALGAFAFGVGATEMASIWRSDMRSTVEVPATIKVNVERQSCHPWSVPRTGDYCTLVGKLGGGGARPSASWSSTATPSGPCRPPGD